ncbi:MAG: 50S ribosomal protein L25 [Chloroflexi bacterium]|nr:MAG: 50S ribosomal protein L25 [Chloroflexota bacterium]TMG70581.1 MAG: 50S ribosomal protein L25 [Chloroflexota bacterium]
MAEAQNLAVRPRTVLGKKVSTLRRQGILPGVIFGGHADSLPIETDLHAFEQRYRRWGNTTLLSLSGIDGGEVSALVYDVSRDPVTGRMLHVDFTRVSLTEKTRADVPLHFVKESPAVRTLGAVLLHALSEVTVEAFPQDIPRAIEVDLSGLQEIDDAIFVRDLVVDATTVRITNDPDELVVKAMPVKIEEEAKPAEAAVPAEGEVAAEGEAAEGATPPTTGAEAAKAPAAEGAKASAAAKPATGAPPKPATGAPKKA